MRCLVERISVKVLYHLLDCLVVGGRVGGGRNLDEVVVNGITLQIVVSLVPFRLA